MCTIQHTRAHSRALLGPHTHTAKLGLGGEEDTVDDKKAAAAIALTAAEECRTFSVLQSTRLFNKWEEEAEEDTAGITGGRGVGYIHVRWLCDSLREKNTTTQNTTDCLTHSKLQSSFGDQLVEIWLVCPQERDCGSKRVNYGGVGSVSIVEKKWKRRRRRHEVFQRE